MIKKVTYLKFCHFDLIYAFTGGLHLVKHNKLNLYWDAEVKYSVEF